MSAPLPCGAPRPARHAGQPAYLPGCVTALVAKGLPGGAREDHPVQFPALLADEPEHHRGPVSLAGRVKVERDETVVGVPHLRPVDTCDQSTVSDRWLKSSSLTYGPACFLASPVVEEGDTDQGRISFLSGRHGPLTA